MITPLLAFRMESVPDNKIAIATICFTVVVTAVIAFVLLLVEAVQNKSKRKKYAALSIVCLAIAIPCWFIVVRIVSAASEYNDSYIKNLESHYGVQTISTNNYSPVHICNKAKDNGLQTESVRIIDKNGNLIDGQIVYTHTGNDSCDATLYKKSNDSGLVPMEEAK